MFITLFVSYGLRKYLAVVCINGSSCILGAQHFLPAVITVINHFLFIRHCIITGITHHTQKKNNENTGHELNLSTRLFPLLLILFFDKLRFFAAFLFSF